MPSVTVPLKARLSTKPHNHTIGDSTNQHVIILELSAISSESERTDHATDHAVDHRVLRRVAVGFSFFFQFIVDISVQGHAAQVQLDFKIVGCQGQIEFACGSGSEQEEFGRVKE